MPCQYFISHEYWWCSHGFPLWRKRPAMWTFLKPHSRSCAALEKGVYVNSPERGNFLCKGIFCACTCDLPARCLLCNGMQYNGENGCWKCLQPGPTVKTGVRGHSRTFPYREDNPKMPIKTSKNVGEYGFETATCRQPGLNRYVVNRVKGPSWLSLLHFDLVWGMGIDYMHGVLLGVQKLVVTLWFSPLFSKEHFSMFSKVENGDGRLKRISATFEVKRLPWDLQESISEADLQEADRLLDGF